MRLQELEISPNIPEMLSDLSKEFEINLADRMSDFEFQKTFLLLRDDEDKCKDAHEHNLTITGPYAISYNSKNDAAGIHSNKINFGDKSSLIVGLKINNTIGFSHRNGSVYYVPQPLGLRYVKNMPIVYLRKAKLGGIETLRLDILGSEYRQVDIVTEHQSVKV